MTRLLSLFMNNFYLMVREQVFVNPEPSKNILRAHFLSHECIVMRSKRVLYNQYFILVTKSHSEPLNCFFYNLIPKACFLIIHILFFILNTPSNLRFVQIIVFVLFDDFKFTVSPLLHSPKIIKPFCSTFLNIIFFINLPTIVPLHHSCS